jgi:hypothetical protein
MTSATEIQNHACNFPQEMPHKKQKFDDIILTVNKKLT